MRHALGGRGDFPDILRFIMRNADVICVSSVASTVAHSLPRDEAFRKLLHGCASKGRYGNGTANITKALAFTKHPEAKNLLLAHLKRLWDEGDLWDDDPFKNWRAFDVTCCIAHLLKLGALPGGLRGTKSDSLRPTPAAATCESCQAFIFGDTTAGCLHKMRDLPGPNTTVLES